VLDVAVQSQLGRIKDFSVTDLETSEEIFFARDSFQIRSHFRTRLGGPWALLLSLLQLIFELDGSVWKHQAVESFVFTLSREST
jgi:hypothetical protein